MRTYSRRMNPRSEVPSAKARMTNTEFKGHHRPPLRPCADSRPPADESTPARLVDGQAKHKQTKCLRSKSRAMFCLSLSPSSSAPFRPSHRGRNIVLGEGAFSVSGVWLEGSSRACSEINHHHHDDSMGETADVTSRCGGAPEGQGRAGEGEKSPRPLQAEESHRGRFVSR
jgi:hypothetical protein